jgi:hypothetical protein
MVPASDRLYQAIVGKRLTLPDNESCARIWRTQSRSTHAELRLDKPGLDQPNDSIIALCMALEALEN